MTTGGGEGVHPGGNCLDLLTCSWDWGGRLMVIRIGNNDDDCIGNSLAVTFPATICLIANAAINTLAYATD
jgi:hypothetical protein